MINSSVWFRIFVIVALPFASGVAATAEDVSLEFGAGANPTKQPIGGGAGYTAGPRRAEARYHVRSLVELRQALAESKPGDTVWIESGSTIDFTGSRLEVPAKVTLAGDRGRDGSAGPLLTAKPSGNEYHLILHSGSRLSGVRVRGSNPSFDKIDSQPSDPPSYAVSCIDAEVDNCEISQFQRGGVGLFRNSVRAHIHHNYLHDIAAYPVLVGNGSGDEHVIEANRIEWAWHAVASNGSRGSGYTARYNVFVRVPRPKRFDESGLDPPNWCLDVHANTGAETNPPRPRTRKLVAHHNTFLAHPEVHVGDGGDLVKSVGLYPKHDIYIGAGVGLTTTVEIHHNLFLMHAASGSRDPNKPYGRAIRLVGLKGDPRLPDDPAATQDVWQVTLGENRFSGRP